MCIQNLQPSQRTQGLFLPLVGRYSCRQMLQRFSSFSTKLCRHFFSLYLLDSDWLTSLLFYSQSFLGLSQVLPVSSLLCFFLFSLFNFSSSCFLRLYSFLFSLSCNFFCFSVSCLAFFLVSYQVKFALTQGHSQNLEYFF